MKIVQATEPPRDAVPQGGDLYLVPDGVELEEDAVELVGMAVRDAFPARLDLPKSHPLYMKRAIRSVPAGMPDIEVSELGELTIAVVAAEPIGETEVIP